MTTIKVVVLKNYRIFINLQVLQINVDCAEMLWSGPVVHLAQVEILILYHDNVATFWLSCKKIFVFLQV